MRNVTKEIIRRIDMRRNSNKKNYVNGKTDFARWTSIMRKLDNELEKEKLSEKRKFVRVDEN